MLCRWLPFPQCKFSFFSPILIFNDMSINNCPGVGVGRTILPFPITVQPTFQGTSISQLGKVGTNLLWQFCELLWPFRDGEFTHSGDPKLKGWRTVTDPTIWRSPSRFGQNNHPNSQSTPFQVINSWKVGDKQTSTFNGENPYTPSEANWESLSTFNWECCINPLLLGWWVYPLFNMEILGVDRPFVAHIC